MGGTPPDVAVVESFDGSSWTEVGDLNTARAQLAGVGTETYAMAIGGRVPPGSTVTGVVELYDGSSWTETTDLSTARRELGEVGTASLALAVGGTGDTDATEEWAFAADIETIAFD